MIPRFGEIIERTFGLEAVTGVDQHRTHDAADLILERHVGSSKVGLIGQRNATRVGVAHRALSHG